MKRFFFRESNKVCFGCRWTFDNEKSSLEFVAKWKWCCDYKYSRIRVWQLFFWWANDHWSVVREISVFCECCPASSSSMQNEFICFLFQWSVCFNQIAVFILERSFLFYLCEIPEFHKRPFKSKKPSKWCFCYGISHLSLV